MDMLTNRKLNAALPGGIRISEDVPIIIADFQAKPAPKQDEAPDTE